MVDQLVTAAIRKLIEVTLKVCARHLRASTNSASHHLVNQTRGLEFEQVRAGVVDAGHKQAHAVGPLAVVLGVGLRAITNLRDNAFHRDWSAVGHLGTERLLLHEVGKDAGVGGQASDGNGHVRVDLDDLLLIGGEFFGITLLLRVGGLGSASWSGIRPEGCDVWVQSNLESDQDGMCLVHQSDNNGSLLHGLLCVLDLEYPTLWRAILQVSG